MAISKIVQNSLADTISLGPKITSVQVANSTYVVKDDTAVNTGGGYIVITGSGFQSNCSVLVDANLACSVAFVSSTQVRAELPAKPAGTYNIYLLNGDGGTAIRVNALQYSNTPIWVTTSPLTSQQEDSNVSIQLSATGANTYVLQTGSTLPNGLTLSANGLISGTVNTDVAIDTTYNFTVEAIDTENQETPKAFAVTINIADTNFYRTVLLIDGDGTNGANNNVFRDSSSNNFTVSRSDNATQGSFTPYTPSNFSGYFSAATSAYIDCGDQNSFTLPNGNYTVEAWVHPEAFRDTGTSNPSAIVGKWGTPAQQEWLLFAGQDANGTLRWYHNNSSLSGSSDFVTTTGTLTIGTWNHVAVVRESNAVNIYINGVKDTGQSYTGSVNTASVGGGTTQVTIGAIEPTYPGYDFTGFISNVRISNNARYTGASFTLPTSKFTNDANTILLTCQSNRVKDESSNGFAISPQNAAKILPFSPYNTSPITKYSTTTHGGSFYLDGSSDYLELPVQPNWRFGSRDFTIETWMWLDNPTNDSTQTLAFHWNGTTNGDVIGSTNVPSCEWVHVAVTRTGTTMKFWVNGVEDSGGAQTISSIIYNNDDVLRIGRGADHTTGSGRDICHCGEVGGSSNKWFFYLRNGGTGSFKGYMTDFRISKSVRYTGTFTPQTSPLASDSNTELLINATNAGIYDWTTKNVIETRGTVNVNTSIAKYGTGSIFFNGSSGYLFSPITHYNDFKTGDFTLEAWIRFNTVGNGQLISAGDGNNGGAYYWQYYSSQLQFGNQGGSNLYANAWSPSAGVWYHVAISRQGTSLRHFVDGTQLGSTVTNSTSFTAGPTFIGWGGAGYFNGNMEDVRITKGFARYTSNFTVPSGPFKTQ